MPKVVSALLAASVFLRTTAATPHDNSLPPVAAVAPALVTGEVPTEGIVAKGAAPETLPPKAPASRAPAGPPLLRMMASRGGIIYVPSSLGDGRHTFDVILHFHGVPERVEQAAETMGVEAVVYSFNLGIGSGPYESAFQDARALDRTLAEVESVVRKRVPALANAHVGRVALSAWSAGYGAVEHILSHQASAERVDAVLLADGLHTGFVGKTKQVNPLALAPFTRFGERAVKGEALMAVTHSSIETYTYASTTRTSEELITELGLPRGEPTEAADPKMIMTSRAEAGGAHVFGFRGTDANAHCEHLFAIDRNLYSFLHDRWAAR